MTKRFFYFASLLCALMLGFTSCEKDGDGGKNGNGGGGGSFGTEQYEAISGLYKVDNTASGIKSIELTAGGEYIIVLTNGGVNYSPAKVIEQKKKSIFVSRKAATRSGYETYVTGTYTYNKDDEEIILDGYGTLLVYSFNPDGSFSAFELETESGRKVQLDVTKQEEVSNSNMTQKLCRTWKPKSEEVIVKVDGKTVLSASYIYATNQVKITNNSYGFEEDYLDEMFSKTLLKVVFSKAGTYMVYHEYDNMVESSMSHWRWKDESKGYLLYYWDDEQDYDYYDEGIVQVKFSNNTMTVSESVEREEGGYSVTATSKIVLVEAGNTSNPGDSGNVGDSDDNSGDSDNFGDSDKEEGGSGSINPSALYGAWQAVSSEYWEYKNGKLVAHEIFPVEEEETWGAELNENGEYYTWEKYGYGGSYDFEYGGTFYYGDNAITLVDEEDGDSMTYEIEELTSNTMILIEVEEYLDEYEGVVYKFVMRETFRKIVFP